MSVLSQLFPKIQSRCMAHSRCPIFVTGAVMCDKIATQGMRIDRGDTEQSMAAPYMTSGSHAGVGWQEGREGEQDTQEMRGTC